MAILESSLTRCPICFSILIEPYSNLSQVATYLKEQEAIPLSTEISELNTGLTTAVIIGLNSISKEGWKSDPIKTKRGFAGDDYKGFTQLDKHLIQSLQDRRTQQEIDIGIEEADRTVFTSLNPNNSLSFWDKKHIIELRQSTEKILKEVGLTKTVETIEMADLGGYFNYDENGVYRGTWKYGNKITDKTEWTDVDRTLEGFETEPKFPTGITEIQNIYIEDLRHSIPLGWVENFTNVSSVNEFVPSSGYMLQLGGWVVDLLDDFFTTSKSDEIAYTSFLSLFQSGETYVSTFPGSYTSNHTVSTNDKKLAVTMNTSIFDSATTVENWTESVTLTLNFTWKEGKFTEPLPNSLIRINKKLRLDYDISGTGYRTFNLSIGFKDAEGTYKGGLIYSINEDFTPHISGSTIFLNEFPTTFNLYDDLILTGRNPETEEFYFVYDFYFNLISTSSILLTSDSKSGSSSSNLDLEIRRITY